MPRSDSLDGGAVLFLDAPGLQRIPGIPGRAFFFVNATPIRFWRQKPTDAVQKEFRPGSCETGAFCPKELCVLCGYQRSPHHEG